jgi:Zn-dependent metalloprotease
MRIQGLSHSVLIKRLRDRAAIWGIGGVAAAFGIVVALVGLTVLFLFAGALGVSSAPQTLSAAVQDAAVALYAVQLVGISFFHGTAEMRFVAIPGLLLVSAAIGTAAALAVKAVRGSERRKMSIALATPVVYALILGTAALFVPLSFTAPGFAAAVTVSPSPVEAFVLPLAWGLLFASIGGLIGIFGTTWRAAASQRLGAWSAPLSSSLRALVVGLLASAILALLGVLTVAGWDLGGLTDDGLGNAIKVVAGTLIALPTAAAAIFVSGFGVPFNWHVDALNHGQGSISIFGGTLPLDSTDPTVGHAAPGVLALAPLVVLATVFAIGWLSARRAGANPQRVVKGAARVAILVTAFVWVLALIARVDAQVGGLLGLHLDPDAGALLWRVPLVAVVGCFAGSFASVLAQGSTARRRLAAGLLHAFRPSGWAWAPSGLGRPDHVSGGAAASGRLTWRAALAISFAAVPVLLVAMGATGEPSSAAPGTLSMAPIMDEAEEVLKEDSTQDETVAVTVNPETRVVDSATVNTPLHALDIAPGQSRPVKAEDVLAEYGELFGLADPADELGNPETSTDEYGGTHVAFAQMKNGLPVYGGGINVSLSHKGELLGFIASSVIPDVSLAGDQPRLSSEEATAVAKQALPSGTLAESPTKQVFAGLSPYISGPNARVAWFIWLVSEADEESAEYVVDAATGNILDVIPKESEAKSRKIYDWKSGPNLPGTLVRSEGGAPTADADVNAAYDNTGKVYDFWKEFAELDSWTNNGAPIISTVNFKDPNGEPLQNAYWNGEQMVFGKGYASSLDVVGHELTHAYTEHTIELVPSGQAGALNEAFSDIVGEVIEWEQTESTDWEMGTNVPGGPFRSLKEPGKYKELAEAGISKPNPGKLSEWIITCLDNFGMHINSTIVSHAFYLAATSPGMNPLETGLVFIEGVTHFLEVPNPTLEVARGAIVKAANAGFGEGSSGAAAVESAFNTVGLNGTAQPPALQDCAIECSFQGALYRQRQSVSPDEAIDMLTTLYKARGQLAMTSTAGDHFLPLYEENMGRITELVTQDPVLAEMTVSGLEEVTPALNGLMEGKGENFELTAEQMGKIEAALERLAEDDRLYGGDDAGQLADLIDHELRWLGLPSYAGMDYQSGFARLNEETEMQSMSLTSEGMVEPNCTGHPYSNNFYVNAFYADTGTYTIPGQVAPMNAGGVICGTAIEATGGKSGCVGEESLNTETSVTLPPGDKVNSSKNLTNKSWVGKLVGRAFACAGNETQLIYGEAGLLSLSSWTEAQCPTAAIACYEGKSTFKKGETLVTGKGYAWIIEEAGSLKLVTKPVTVSAPEGYFVTVGFGQFRVELCARAGSSETKSCGGPTATWIHQNGNAAERGCESGIGRFYMKAKNDAGKSTVPVTTCVRWDKGAHMQTIDAPNSVGAVACVPSSTTCVTGDSKGNAQYSTNVSSSGASTWNSWTGPGVSPIYDVACPSSTLCLVAAGTVEGGGGSVYRTSSLGGSWLSSFKPANGVGALSCPTTSFCVAALEGGGYIRYTTNPSGIVWTAVEIGTGAMKDVACLSSSFCAVVDAAGNIRVATSATKVKEAGGWTATSVNGGSALRSVACSSTTSCIAVGGTTKLLKLTIAESGAATVSSQTLSGAGALSDVTCTGATCIASDESGNVFSSTNSGTTWSKPYEAKENLTSVACASESLCAEPTTSGDIAKLDPTP